MTAILNKDASDLIRCYFTLVIGLLFWQAPSLGNVAIGGYTFADNAFPDVLLDQYGSFHLTGANTLADTVLGADLNSYVQASSSSSNARYTVGYVDNVVRNISGPDLAFFELWINDNFYIEINGIRRLINTQYNVGQGPHGTLNLGLVDLDDFGIPSHGTIDQLTVWIGSNWSPSSYNPILTISGAVIPEPATLSFLITGGVAFLFHRRNIRRKV